MTISYQRDVASSTAGGFTRLLFKWKGSLYKLIYRELFLFQSAYILLSLVYRQLLTQHQRGLFEMVVKYFDAFLNLIPLSFVLGFYVSYVASRWWQQFLAIPWPDKLFHSVACFVDGFDEESRMLRRSLMRYMNLALILVLRSISSAVKQRFPTLEHVVEAGFMTNQEKELFLAVPCNEFNTYWIPCTWFIYRLQEAAKRGKLLNHYALETIMREFCEFRAKCGLLWCYDWVSIPMVYTQVVTLATYLFFVFTVIGRQKIDTLKKGEYMRSGRMPLDIDLYIPVYTILQFFFFMGLLKVAEQLINPFGDDDEDFELNWLIDRHMKVVTLATYLFFVFTVIGRQKIDTLKKGEYMRSGRMPLDIDLYFPVYTILQFFFYMGLLKVAEQLINPFGDDDEDFELNWLIDRHMKASFLGCDILMDPDRIPPMVKDYYWDKQNCPIPYTEASMHFKRKTYKGSADEIIVPESKQHMVLPEIEEEDEDLNQRHSKLSLTSLLLESTQVVTSASMGLGPSYSPYSMKSSNIVAKIGLGDSHASSTVGPEQGLIGKSPTPAYLNHGHGGNGIMGHTPTPDVYEGSSTPLPQGTRAFQSGSWRHSQTPQPSNYPTGTRRNDEVLASSSSSHQLAPSVASRRCSTGSLSAFWGTGSVESITDEEEIDLRRGSLAPSLMSSAGGKSGSRLLDFLDKKSKKPKRYKDKQGFVWRRMVHNSEDLPSPRTPHLGPGAASWSSTPIPSLAPINNYVQSQEVDSASLTSFKTCPSDPNLSSLVPRQVSENYNTGRPSVPLPIIVSPRPASAGGGSVTQTQKPVKTTENVVGGVKHLVRDR